jgi:hypothetical protein
MKSSAKVISLKKASSYPINGIVWKNTIMRIEQLGREDALLVQNFGEEGHGTE